MIIDNNLPIGKNNKQICDRLRKENETLSLVRQVTERTKTTVILVHHKSTVFILGPKELRWFDNQTS